MSSERAVSVSWNDGCANWSACSAARPADVRAQCNHDAVMRAPWPAAGMPF